MPDLNEKVKLLLFYSSSGYFVGFDVFGDCGFGFPCGETVKKCVIFKRL